MPVLFAAPAFLLAGALAVLVPLALHLIRRRPPVRAPLPTARFLAEDSRTAVRVSRPTDLPLLALRMLLLLLLAVGLAGPAWLPAAVGTAPVVLVDRALSGDGWRRAVDDARRTLLGADGAGRGALVLFDTAARVVDGTRLSAAFFDSLAAAGPSAAPTDLAAGFRALPAAARGVRGADSVRVRLVSAFAGGWSEGAGAVRRSAWPGSVALAQVPGPDSAAPAGPAAAGSAVVAAREGGAFTAAALEALGYAVRRAADGLPERAGVYFVLGAAPDEPRRRALAEAGATVVVATAGTGEAGGELHFGPGVRLVGAGPRRALAPAAGGTLLAAWDDGTPAAVARRQGAGCRVEVGTALEAGEFPFQAAYPAALARLAQGCAGGGQEAALDAGALAVLRGRGPESVSAASLGAARGGTPLGRWFLAAALAAALVEALAAYRRRP